MKRQRFFLGPIKDPTWKDFVVRVGGALVLIAAVILASREFFPAYQGIALIVVSVGIVVFAGVQDWRQKKARRAERKR